MSAYKYRVSKNELITPSIRQLTLALDASAPAFLYEPGQYVAISLRDRLRPTTNRCFSVSSSPTNRRVLEICARVKGKYTSALGRLKPGDEVAVRGPFGKFVFNEAAHSDLVMFAGGIGITPFMSMVRYAAETGSKSRMHLVYGCRGEDGIAFLDELAALQKQNPNFRLTLAVTGSLQNAPEGVEVVQGRVDASVVRGSVGGAGKRYMICGPAPFISSVRGLLRKNGVPGRRILSEAFAQDSSAQGESLFRWPANVYALAGVSLLFAGFLVAMKDLNKTLPAFFESAGQAPSGQDGPQGAGSNSKIASIPPQVDTRITQDPVVVSEPSVASPAVPQAPVVSRPIATTTVAAPVSRPRTRVS